jgi:hypothetical protein
MGGGGHIVSLVWKGSFFCGIYDKQLPLSVKGIAVDCNDLLQTGTYYTEDTYLSHNEYNTLYCVHENRNEVLATCRNTFVVISTDVYRSVFASRNLGFLKIVYLFKFMLL